MTFEWLGPELSPAQTSMIAVRLTGWVITEMLICGYKGTVLYTDMASMTVRRVALIFANDAVGISLPANSAQRQAIKVLGIGSSDEPAGPVLRKTISAVSCCNATLLSQSG